MNKLLPLFLLLMAAGLLTAGCKFAPKQQLGDTVSAQVFEPVDPTKAILKTRNDSIEQPKDSVDIFIIGEGSTSRFLQLISYPSRRDTAFYGKRRPFRVRGSAQYGRVVRIGFVTDSLGKNLVKTIEELKTSADTIS